MLSIAKLRVGQEAYQLTGVARSLDDYYSGAGEAPGRWRGGGAVRLGLSGEVDGADLRAVLAGLAPGTGGLTPNGTTQKPSKNRVPGFDLTFKLPKSASVLYAVSDDPRVQGAIIEAGEAGVTEALAWLEREAIRAQRGSHNKAWLDARRAAGDPNIDRLGPRRITTSGVVAASFRHRTSRAADPLLHWHVLVANLVEGADGRWSAFAHPDMYRAARAAGEIFQATVRRELVTSLGLHWRPGRHVPEIAGVPDRIIDMFSKRRHEIDAWLRAQGLPADPIASQQATLATRRNKPEMEGERLDARWKTEAQAAGWGPDRAARLVHRMSRRRPTSEQDGLWRMPEVTFSDDGTPLHYDRIVSVDEWIADLLRRDLTQTSTTFTRFDVTQAVAARLTAGATTTTIERVAATVLASDQVVAVHEPNVDGPRGRARYTSAEVVDVERRFLTALSRRSDDLALPDDALANAIVRRSTLGDDQAAAVTTIGRNTRAVSMLVGPAGTGKTFTLDAVREAYETAGFTVIGAAPSARAAIELHSGAGIPSRTLHALLAAWERGEERPDRSTVLVVDEAGMAGLRILEKAVTRTVEAGGRVVLVGDQHQLPEIEAGGGFAAAASRGGTAVLSVNRRQRERWEQVALSALRCGDVPAAVVAYRAHDRVVATADRTAMVADAIDRWTNARARGAQPALLAGTNELVDVLNVAARDRLIEAGELSAHAEGTFGGRAFRTGERVVLRRNSTAGRTLDEREVTVANGHTGTVLAVGQDHMTIRRDLDGADITVDHRYLRQGGYVDLAYAFTTTRAQGGTWDLAITVGLDGLYREAAYVDLSRGRESNWLVLTQDEASRVDQMVELEHHDKGLPLPGEHPDLDTEVVQTFGKSRAKQLAHTIDPDLEEVEHLARTVPLDQLIERRDAALEAERIATEKVGAHPDELLATLARAEHTATHVAVGQKVKVWDRANIGTVVALDNEHGQVVVQFRSAAGRVAERPVSWDQVGVVDPAEPRVPSDQAAAGLESLRRDTATAVRRWRSSAAADEGVHADLLSRAIVRAAAITAAGPVRGHVDGLPDPEPAIVRPQRQAPAIVRSAAEIRERMDTLDALFADAPRGSSGSRVGGADRDRATWILENWPHIVEREQLLAHAVETTVGSGVDLGLETGP